MIDAALRKLLGLHLHLVGVETSDFDGMLDNIRAYTLLPRDALLVAIIQRMGDHSGLG
jgi:predicted nucleic acid-binding protein